jgi:hypothetical protein
MALLEPFDGLCLKHALSEVCQYIITNEKMFVGLVPYTSIKDIQSTTQKCTTWFKKIGKGRQAWDKTYSEFEMKPRKLNMPMKTR